MEAVEMLKPRSICDIGIGCGKYGMLFREGLGLRRPDEPLAGKSLLAEDFRLDGVEVCEAYVGPAQRAIYDHIYIGDIVELCDKLGDYDLFTMLDVIEHMDLETGMTLLKRLRAKARIGVLVVTPIGEYPQGELYGNPHEVHRSTWGKAQWKGLDRTRYMAVGEKKWLALVEGKESGRAPWLRMTRLRRRFRVACMAAGDALFPGRVILPRL